MYQADTDPIAKCIMLINTAHITPFMANPASNSSRNHSVVASNAESGCPSNFSFQPSKERPEGAYIISIIGAQSC